MAISILKQQLTASPRSNHEYELLVYGYIRLIGKELDIAIPASLSQQFYKFYCEPSIMDRFIALLLAKIMLYLKNKDEKLLKEIQKANKMLLDIDCYEIEFLTVFFKRMTIIYSNQARELEIKFSHMKDEIFLENIHKAFEREKEKDMLYVVGGAAGGVHEELMELYQKIMYKMFMDCLLSKYGDSENGHEQILAGKSNEYIAAVLKVFEKVDSNKYTKIQKAITENNGNEKLMEIDD